MTTRAAFLDLNGTLVEPVRVSHPRELASVPGLAEAVRLLNRHGFVCPVVTVQTRIAKGLFTEEDFRGWFAGFQASLLSEGAEVRGPYLCPHRSADHCACKKPAPLLYLQAAREYNIDDLAGSVVIGDTTGDVRAARTLGCRGVLVRTGWGEGALRDHNAGEHADFIAADVLEAARWATAITEEDRP